MSPTAHEMLAHLATVADGMTTRELAAHCPSAPDRTAISRAAYDLRQEGLIEAIDTTPSHTGRGARPVAVYAITQEGLRVLGAEQPEDQLPGALDEAPDEDRQAAAAAWNNGEPFKPVAKCPVCHGDDHQGACAYPGEHLPGCLRNQPDYRRRGVLDEIAERGMTLEPPVADPGDGLRLTVLRIAIHPAATSPTYGDGIWVDLADDGAGPYLIIRNPGASREAGLSVDLSELPLIAEAAARLMGGTQ